MIFGECPNCKASVSNTLAPGAPCFEKILCNHCDQFYWLRHSRLNPVAYTEIGFQELYSVDEETKVITAKEGT